MKEKRVRNKIDGCFIEQRCYNVEELISFLNTLPKDTPINEGRCVLTYMMPLQRHYSFVKNKEDHKPKTMLLIEDIYED